MHSLLVQGGSIVIDVTEALVSIDINSARATKGGTSRKPHCRPISRQPTRLPDSFACAMSVD